MKYAGKSLAAASILVALGSAYALAQQSGPAAPFAQEQVASGRNAYLENCAGCHGNNLGGGN